MIVPLPQLGSGPSPNHLSGFEGVYMGPCDRINLFDLDILDIKNPPD